jgi:hypothetical protein
MDRNVKKTVKHGGGSLMVWGCISWNGTGRLHRIDGPMNAAKYCEILSDSLLGSLADQSTPISDIIYQQDNDPKHTSRLAMKWFRDHGFQMLPWPAQSPDMNIIKHAWDVLDRQIRTRNPLPHNLDELWVALQEEWENLDMGAVRKLYDSIPRRIEALNDENGGYTRY